MRFISPHCSSSHYSHWEQLWMSTNDCTAFCLETNSKILFKDFAIALQYSPLCISRIKMASAPQNATLCLPKTEQLSRCRLKVLEKQLDVLHITVQIKDILKKLFLKLKSPILQLNSTILCHWWKHNSYTDHTGTELPSKSPSKKDTKMTTIRGMVLQTCFSSHQGITKHDWQKGSATAHQK